MTKKAGFTLIILLFVGISALVVKSMQEGVEVRQACEQIRQDIAALELEKTCPESEFYGFCTAQSYDRYSSLSRQQEHCPRWQKKPKT